ERRIHYSVLVVLQRNVYAAVPDISNIQRELSRQSTLVSQIPRFYVRIEVVFGDDYIRLALQQRRVDWNNTVRGNCRHQRSREAFSKRSRGTVRKNRRSEIAQ